MENNLSKITATKVLKALNEATDSGVPRLARIQMNASKLCEQLGNPTEVDMSLSMKLITWNDENRNTAIPKAIKEIENYEKLIDLLISSIDKLDIVLPSVKAFNYKSLSNLLDNVYAKSKIISRINNLKFLCTLYSKKNNAQAKKFLFERILGEIYTQKAFLSIFKENMRDFIADDKFLLGMLLYDIPGNDSDRLNFIETLKSHGIKI